MALRLKRLREDRGLTQEEMADGLQIRYETYKKQERRGGLRADLYKPFGLIVGMDVDTLTTARLDEEMALAKARPKVKKRRRKKLTAKARRLVQNHI